MNERKNNHPLEFLPAAIGVAYVLFHLATAGYRTLPGVKQMVVHLGFALVMIFSNMFVNACKERRVFSAIVHMAMMMAGFAISVYNWTAVELASGAAAGRVTLENAVIGTVFLVLVLVATHNRVGKGLPILVLVFLAYAMFGNLLPQPYGHRGYTLTRIVGNLCLGTDAIWGTVLQASSVLIAIFIIFGAVLQLIRGGEFMAEFAQGLLGNVNGGPAKVAVMASALFGSISGSVAANVVGSGSVTIPLMKKTGFEPEYAAAVEAIASTGGQLMPPVMGATAFILADYCGVTYSSLILLAIVPAILYYFHLLLQVHLYAKKMNLPLLDKAEMPDIKKVIRWGGHLFIPLAVIIYCLVFSNLSVSRSAFYGILSGILVSFFNKETRIDIRKVAPVLKNCAMGISMIAVSCAAAGMIVGVFSLTGLGHKISNLLIFISGNSMFILLVITMIAALILGMGLPTTAAYIILASLVAPALIQFGIPKIVAHFFIFYFGIYANITPPVAVGLYAAIGIAGTTRIWTTSKNALLLGLTGFIMPYMLLYRSGLMLQGGWQTIIMDIGVTVAAIIVFNIAHAGYLMGRTIPGWLRIALFVSCVVMAGPWGGTKADLLGMVAAGALLAAILQCKPQRVEAV